MLTKEQSVCSIDQTKAHTDVCYCVGDQSPRKNYGSHIDASHSRQPLVKGERLVRYEVNAVMLTGDAAAAYQSSKCVCW